MRILYITILAVVTSFYAQGQVHLQKMWDHTYGGNGAEIITEMIQTTDSGFVMAGHTNSAAGLDVTDPSRGNADYWIVRTDSGGNKVWDKRFGGNGSDFVFALLQTTDGGFLVGGNTTSDSGADVSQPLRGSADFWVVRMDSSGNKLWDKRYGGIDKDQMFCAIQTPDNGFLLGGMSEGSNNGDFQHTNYGGGDFWLIKIDSVGTIQWEQHYGGDQTDEMYAIAATNDGGYILGGRVYSSNNNDVSEVTRGDYDYWILKINATGTKIWDKRYGGFERDYLFDLKITHDNKIILGGYIWSDMSADVTEPTRDTTASLTSNRGDVWLILTDSAGGKIWDHRFGGHWVEDAFGYVIETHDHGFMFGTASYSNMSGDKSENNFGYEQAWILKTDSNGIKLWDKTVHVDGEDEYAYLIESSPGCYVISDWSGADSSSYKSENSRGGTDYWIIKFCETSQPQLPVANFTPSYDALCENGCFDFTNQSTNASSFQWFFPGGVPSSSTAGFPLGICYSAPGSYDVTLIATNTDGSDTLTVIGAVSIVTSPTFTIAQQGDTLLAPQGFNVYQWWEFNGTTFVPMPSEVNYFLVATQNGDYLVTVEDTNGCFGVDTLFQFNVLVNEFVSNDRTITVYPNPATSEIHLTGLDNTAEGILQIRDLTGRLIFTKKVNGDEYTLPVSDLTIGVYLIEIEYKSGRYFARFVKD